MATAFVCRRLNQAISRQPHLIISRNYVMNTSRLSSTLVGLSGRTYVRQKLLCVHPDNPQLNPYTASSENKEYILKPVSSSIFNFLQKVKVTFGRDPRLRIHLDQNDEEHTLVYDYSKTDLLALIRNYPVLPLTARKQILFEVGRALHTMHSRDWIHLDLKPDNVMLNWYVDDKDLFILQKVVLGDIDCALELVESKTLDAIIGNAMWRSPEGQLGKGIGKHSEVFSFGLLCIFVITGREWLHYDHDSLETSSEPGMLFKLLIAFGPLPEGLVSHVADAYGKALLRGLWQEIEDEGLSDPFEHWQEQTLPNLDHNTKRLISRMTNLDPARRLTISEVLGDSYWKGIVSDDAVDVEECIKG